MTPLRYTSARSTASTHFGNEADCVTDGTSRGSGCSVLAVAAARDAGKYRLEGKEYVFQDGDVALFRFNN